MPIVGDKPLTMADWVKRLGPDNKIGRIAEILNKDNPITEDAPVLEANNGTYHTTTVRASLPTATWRRLNKGVPLSKSRTEQKDEQTGVLETWSEVDQALLDLSGDSSGLLLTESKPFLEAMKQQMAETMFYGSRDADPASFNGLGSRFHTLDKAKSQTARNILDMGGTGNDLTSVWLTVWGESTLHLIYPKGTTIGVDYKVYADQVLLDDQGHPYAGHRTHYKWYTGMVLRDWRYVVRLANIDTRNLGDLISNGAGDPAKSALVRALVQGINLVPNIRDGKACLYMNRGVKTQLELMAMEKGNVNLTIDSFEGKPITRFRGIPIHQCDALIEHEEQIVA